MLGAEKAFFVLPVTTGKVLEVSPWRMKGRTAEGTIWEECGIQR